MSSTLPNNEFESNFNTDKSFALKPKTMQNEYFEHINELESMNNARQAADFT